jgi:hypothetical protein
MSDSDFVNLTMNKCVLVLHLLWRLSSSLHTKFFDNQTHWFPSLLAWLSIFAAGRFVIPREILARWNSNVWCDRIWLSTCRFWFVAVCQYSGIRLTRWSFWKCFASVSFSHWDGFSDKHSNPIIEICLITCFIWWSRVHLSHSVLLPFFVSLNLVYFTSLFYLLQPSFSQ